MGSSNNIFNFDFASFILSLSLSLLLVFPLICQECYAVNRSVLRMMMEKDMNAGNHICVCVTAIRVGGGSSDKNTVGAASNSSSVSNPSFSTSGVIEVTDGWYGINARLDSALTKALKNGRVSHDSYRVLVKSQ